jgi:hypothetical protein
MKKLAVLLVLVVVFTVVALGCASSKKYGMWNAGVDEVARREVKIEIIQVDDDLSKMPKELSIIEVVRAPDADPALSDAILEKMKEKIIGEFGRDGWVIREGAPLKLNVSLSKCDGKEITGRVMLGKEGKPGPGTIFSATLVRSKQIMGFHPTTTYVSDDQLRMAFAIGIIQTIDDQAKNVEQK